jgi:hypothetical protein
MEFKEKLTGKGLAPLKIKFWGKMRGDMCLRYALWGRGCSMAGADRDVAIGLCCVMKSSGAENIR